MRYQLIISFIFLFFISCKKTPPTIEIIDFNKFSMVGVPVKEQKKITDERFRLIELKTKNHLVPAINLKNSNGEEVRLKSLYNGQKSILLFANSTCPACDIAYQKNFPTIGDSLTKRDIKHRFIPIIVQYDQDIEKADRFKKKKKELEEFYQEVYVISDTIAAQFNIYGYPVQIFLDEIGVVEKYNFGAAYDVNKKRMAEVIDFFER